MGNEIEFSEQKKGEPVAKALEKLEEAYRIPGLTVAFDPAEAEALGVFVEDAISEAEAVDSHLGVGE